MSNVDLLIFLDSPNAVKSDWVHKELARAHDLGMGVLQLVWPDHSASIGTELCDRFALSKADFVPTPPTDSSTFTEPCVKLILQAAERSRIRSLSHRRRRLSDTICTTASHLNLDVSMHPVCPYAIRRDDSVVGHVIPYIGLPDARSVQEHEEEIQKNRCNDDYNERSLAIVFEGLGMDANWNAHLDWLHDLVNMRAFSTVGLRQFKDSAGLLQFCWL